MILAWQVRYIYTWRYVKWTLGMWESCAHRFPLRYQCYRCTQRQ